ncbi:hypothetical protein ACFLU8_02455 [Chloroflexota bacterium]
MYFIRDYEGPKPYQPGPAPDVLILGQDPTVDQHRKFYSVLGLEKPGSREENESRLLQRYIKDRILQKLGIDESRIIATNLVNAYYHDVPNKKIAKLYEKQIIRAAKKIGIDIAKYPEKANGAILHALNFECATRKELELTIRDHPIDHVITLGEPVYQVLRERYCLDLIPKIKDILKSIGREPPRVLVAQKEITLLPLPHIFNERNPKWKFYRDFMDNKLFLLAEVYKR